MESKIEVETAKKSYETPTLTEIGRVEDITQGSNGGGTDGGAASV